MNPSYYDLENTESSTVNAYLSRIVTDTLQDLEDVGCVEVDEDNFVNPLMLGTVACQYYLSYKTVSLFITNIGSETSLKILFHVLCGASEYDELPVCHNEEHINEVLSKDVEYEVDKYSLDDPHEENNQVVWFWAGDMDSGVSVPFQCKTVKGTFGYLTPEYFQHVKVSEKIEIYAFGVVLLELLVGKKPIETKKLGDS